MKSTKISKLLGIGLTIALLTSLLTVAVPASAITQPTVTLVTAGVDNIISRTNASYIINWPKDPKTGQEYLYEVSAQFDTFTLKAPLDAPSSGTTGYLCNQEECGAY